MRAVQRLLFLAVLVGSALALTRVPAPPREPMAARIGLSVTDVRHWGYQLQRTDPARIAADVDLLVIDYARGPRPLTAEDVQRFRTRPDGTQRLVLAYLSIGEAESYRYYWWPHWHIAPPDWLGAENPEWKGNYRVRYWEPGWRAIMLQARASTGDRLLEAIAPAAKPYVDRILEAGFDGVYLDRVDAYYEWAASRPSAEHDMVSFVIEISDYVKARRPGFLVAVQNAEELLSHARYRRHIDAVAKEDLWFGVGGEEVANETHEVGRSELLLDRARADGKPVFVVEYLTDPAKRAQVRRLAALRGYVPLFASRLLDRPPEVLEPTPPRLNN